MVLTVCYNTEFSGLRVRGMEAIVADSEKLTEREQHTLAGIERELREDEWLSRALSTMQPATERTRRSFRGWLYLAWALMALWCCIVLGGIVLQVTEFMLVGLLLSVLTAAGLAGLYAWRRQHSGL